MQAVNEWGDPENTVYVAWMYDAGGATLLRIFRDWRAANEYVDAEYTRYLKTYADRAAEMPYAEFTVVPESIH